MQNILITGGTGTLGTQLTLNLHETANVTVLSRDEKKLVELRNRFPNVRILVGDIRRPLRDRDHLRYDTIFHCAALKHVDIGEAFPDEFYETNYVGTKHVWELAERMNVSNFVFFSTDKAVLPINAYGYSKAMAEKFLLACGKPKIYRWGNIIGSRGSVIPHFVECIKNGMPCVITDKRMTRFWLTIEEAIEFVLDTYENVRSVSSDIADIVDHCGTLMIHPKIKSASVEDIVTALGKVIGQNPIIEYGKIRPGEKIHECLRTGHDYCIRSDNCDKYTESELIDKLNTFMGH